jgi:hypothetical protein
MTRLEGRRFAGLYAAGTVGAMAVATVLVTAGQARADSLTLTALGIGDGFTLTTFATTNPGNTGCCAGPFGVAAAGGQVIVGIGGNGVGPRYVFADVDGQTVASALHTNTSFPTFVGAFAAAGGVVYGNDFNTGQFLAFNADGSVNHVLTDVTVFAQLGMWTDPANGDLIAQSTSGIIDINPLANGGLGSFRTINGTLGDGLSVSPDGTTVYSEQTDIIGYNIATGLKTFDSGPLGCSGPDGSGVITSHNLLNGDLVVDCNDGTVLLIDPTTLAQTVIATGGSRLDFASPDSSNGSLFIDASDSVHRLSCPSCSFTGSPVPEPTTMMLLGTGLAGLVARHRRKRSQAERHV